MKKIFAIIVLCVISTLGFAQWQVEVILDNPTMGDRGGWATYYGDGGSGLFVFRTNVGFLISSKHHIFDCRYKSEDELVVDGIKVEVLDDKGKVVLSETWDDVYVGESRNQAIMPGKWYVWKLILETKGTIRVSCPNLKGGKLNFTLPTYSDDAGYKTVYGVP